MPLNLAELPFDILFKIAEHLDVGDVLRVRQTSKRLSELSRERTVWNSLYRTCRLARPLGPHPSQTRENLESILTCTSSVHYGVFQRTEPIRSRIFRVSEDSETLEFCGRWAFMRRPDRVDCLDLSIPNSEHAEPRQFIVWEANRQEGLEVLAMDCLDVVAHDGRKHAVVVLDLRAKGPPTERIEIIILKIYFDNNSELGLRWETVYRKVFSDVVSLEPIYPYISPTALLVEVGLHQGIALVWDIEQLDKEPAIIPREDTDNEDDFPLFFVSSTHVVAFTGVDDSPPMTRIRAWPIATVLAGTTHLRASAVINNVFLQSASILRDSVLDHNSAKTEIIFVGQLSSEYLNEFPLAVGRLFIPPEDNLDHALTLSLQTVTQFTSDPIFVLNPSWLGSMRIVYELEEYPVGRLGVVEVVYDEETQSATAICSPSLGVASGVQGHFQRDGEIQSSENEPRFGRILYTYYPQHSEVSEPGIIPEEQRMLRVIDFA